MLGDHVIKDEDRAREMALELQVAPVGAMIVCILEFQGQDNYFVGYRQPDGYWRYRGYGGGVSTASARAVVNVYHTGMWVIM